MTANIENIKRLQAADYPIDTGFRCFEIIIPDDPKHLAALNGMVRILGLNWAWAGTIEDRQSRSQLWREASALTDWEEMCMDCEGVAECIDTDTTVQDALTQWIINSLNSNTTIQQLIRDLSETKLGGERPTSQNGTNLNQSGLCDNGRRANAAIQLVDWMNQNNQDWLEKVSSAATPYTRSQVLAENLPNFSTGVLGEAISEIFTFFSAAFKTNYEAAVDNAYLGRLYYDVWCASSIDCDLSIDDLYLLLSARVGFEPVGLHTFV